MHIPDSASDLRQAAASRPCQHNGNSSAFCADCFCAGPASAASVIPASDTPEDAASTPLSGPGASAATQQPAFQAPSSPCGASTLSDSDVDITTTTSIPPERPVAASSCIPTSTSVPAGGMAASASQQPGGGPPGSSGIPAPAQPFVSNAFDASSSGGQQPGSRPLRSAAGALGAPRQQSGFVPSVPSRAVPGNPRQSAAAAQVPNASQQRPAASAAPLQAGKAAATQAASLHGAGSRAPLGRQAPGGAPVQQMDGDAPRQAHRQQSLHSMRPVPPPQASLRDAQDFFVLQQPHPSLRPLWTAGPHAEGSGPQHAASHAESGAHMSAASPAMASNQGQRAGQSGAWASHSRRKSRDEWAADSDGDSADDTADRDRGGSGGSSGDEPELVGESNKPARRPQPMQRAAPQPAPVGSTRPQAPTDHAAAPPPHGPVAPSIPGHAPTIGQPPVVLTVPLPTSRGVLGRLRERLDPEDRNRTAALLAGTPGPRPMPDAVAPSARSSAPQAAVAQPQPASCQQGTGKTPDTAPAVHGNDAGSQPQSRHAAAQVPHGKPAGGAKRRKVVSEANFSGLQDPPSHVSPYPLASPRRAPGVPAMVSLLPF